jgi:hypothetical protein
MSDYEEIEIPKEDHFCFWNKGDRLNDVIKMIDSNTLKTKTILIKLGEDKYEFFKSKKDR